VSATLLALAAAATESTFHLSVETWSQPGKTGREAGHDTVRLAQGLKTRYVMRLGDDVLATLVLEAMDACTVRVTVVSASDRLSSRSPSAWPVVLHPNESFSLGFIFGHETFDFGGTIRGGTDCGTRSPNLRFERP
jgi:hypothetical protein